MHPKKKGSSQLNIESLAEILNEMKEEQKFDEK